MAYTETTETFKNLGELQADLFHTLKQIRETGARNLDAEIVIDLQDFSITIVAPEKELSEN